VFDAPQATAGATGTITATISGSASTAVAILAALRPAAGTTTPANVITYSYDQANRLTRYSTTSPASSNAYAYNGDGLRVSSTDATGTHAYSWDSSGALPLLLSDGVNDYLYGPDGALLERITGATPIYLSHDRIGSVRLSTDATGAVAGTTSFDPYGNVTKRTGTSPGLFGFAGEYTDPTGLIYLRARYYDPATAQFLTVDPAYETTLTRYGYSTNSPLDHTDPTGLGPLGPVEIPDGPAGASAVQAGDPQAAADAFGQGLDIAGGGIPRQEAMFTDEQGGLPITRQSCNLCRYITLDPDHGYYLGGQLERDYATWANQVESHPAARDSAILAQQAAAYQAAGGDRGEQQRLAQYMHSLGRDSFVPSAPNFC
jgi:RHS repeat-associated protein